MFDRFDPDIGNQLLDVVLGNIQMQLVQQGLKKFERNFIGMGPVPAEDCCPDLVGWISNLRLWDAASPDQLRENRVLQNTFGIAFDLNIRIGLCYLEGDIKAYDSKFITTESKELNRYGFVAYLAAVHALTEFTYNCGNSGECEIDVLPQSMFPYNTGGCAGWNFVATVAVL